MSFEHTVRVYWEDTDAGGIVFYANYLKFFERARTEWLRSLGIGQQQLKIDLGCMFVVSETHVKYLLPAVLDDVLDIETIIIERGKSSITLEQKAYKRQPPSLGQSDTLGNYNMEPRSIDEQSGRKLLCSGTIRIGWINVQTGRPTRIPSFIQDVL